MTTKIQILLQAQELSTKADLTIRLEALVRKIGELYDVNPAKILSTTQNHRVVEARAIIALTLYLSGYTYSDIGRLLKKHYTTIRYYCDTIETKLGTKDAPNLQLKKVLRYMKILDNNITDELIARNLYGTDIFTSDKTSV